MGTRQSPPHCVKNGGNPTRKMCLIGCVSCIGVGWEATQYKGMPLCWAAGMVKLCMGWEREAAECNMAHVFMFCRKESCWSCSTFKKGRDIPCMHGHLPFHFHIPLSPCCIVCPLFTTTGRYNSPCCTKIDGMKVVPPPGAEIMGNEGGGGPSLHLVLFLRLSFLPVSKSR